MKVYLIKEKLAMVSHCTYDNSLMALMSLYEILRSDFHSPSVGISVNYNNVWIEVIGPPSYDRIIGMFFKVDEYEVPDDYIKYSNLMAFTR